VREVRIQGEYPNICKIFLSHLWPTSTLCFGLLFSSYTLDISSLSDEELAKIFSPSVDSVLTLLIISFAVKKLFNLMQSHLSILGNIS
jgi:hypothetical protein